MRKSGTVQGFSEEGFEDTHFCLDAEHELGGDNEIGWRRRCDSTAGSICWETAERAYLASVAALGNNPFRAVAGPEPR